MALTPEMVDSGMVTLVGEAVVCPECFMDHGGMTIANATSAPGEPVVMSLDIGEATDIGETFDLRGNTLTVIGYRTMEDDPDALIMWTTHLVTGPFNPYVRVTRWFLTDRDNDNGLGIWTEMAGGDLLEVCAAAAP